jgi:hypothetical protein
VTARGRGWFGAVAALPGHVCGKHMACSGVRCFGHLGPVARRAHLRVSGLLVSIGSLGAFEGGSLGALFWADLWRWEVGPRCWWYAGAGVCVLRAISCPFRASALFWALWVRGSRWDGECLAEWWAQRVGTLRTRHGGDVGPIGAVFCSPSQRDFWPKFSGCFGALSLECWGRSQACGRRVSRAMRVGWWLELGGGACAVLGLDRVGALGAQSGGEGVQREFGTLRSSSALWELGLFVAPGFWHRC